MDKITSPIQRGVTLIESLVALLIFLIVAVGWLSLEARLAKTSGDSHVIGQGVFVGQNMLDRIRLLGFDDLDSSAEETSYFNAEGIQVEGPSEDELIYAVNWTSVAPDEDADRRQIAVYVSWNIKNEAQDFLELEMERIR